MLRDLPPLSASSFQFGTRLKRLCASVGIVVLLSGFSVSEIEFNSASVPPSEFKIRLAQQKGLPAPQGTPGMPVTATLARPGGNGPFPAVVLFPAAGGWPDTPRHWRSLLNGWGYVTLEVGPDDEVPGNFEPTTQVLDAMGALQYLRGLSYVDRDRIAVMGWSLGAETALWAVDASGWAGKQAFRFAAAVAIYPYCSSAAQFFAPALIISAERDDIVRPYTCESLVRGVPPGFRIPQHKIMPGAFHWFDLPHPPAQSYDMSYEYNERATVAAQGHVRSFLEENL